MALAAVWLLVLALGVPIAGFTADAPAPGTTHRIGVLSTTLEGTSEALRESLRGLGYVEGRNLVIEMRATEGRADRVDALARDLVQAKVDVIVATNPSSVFAARRATSTIPIVMVNTPDPVQLGLVKSLARPGGNVTGTTSLSVDLSIKQLELIAEALPRAARIAVVWNPDNPWHSFTVKGLQQAGKSLGAQLQFLSVRSASEFDGAFESMRKERARAVLVLADPLTYFHRKRLADLAITHHLPMMGSLRDYAEAGSLMSYWAAAPELSRRTASYVDRILKGAAPASLPVEQATVYELVVNLRTAKALALTIPQSLLLRATVIE